MLAAYGTQKKAQWPGKHSFTSRIMQSMDDFQGAPFTAAMLFAVGIWVDREMLVNNILPTRPMFLDGSMLQFFGICSPHSCHLF